MQAEGWKCPIGVCQATHMRLGDRTGSAAVPGYYICCGDPLQNHNIATVITTTKIRLKRGELVSLPYLKITECFRDMGLGYSALERLTLHCGIPLLSNKTYARLETIVNRYVKETVDEIIDDNIEILKNGDSSATIDMNGDGSWKRRGHNSRHGAYDLMCENMVISYHTMTLNHNYEGTSCGMEREGMTICLQKAHEKGLVCNNFTADQDTSVSTVLQTYNEKNNANAQKGFTQNIFFFSSYKKTILNKKYSS